MPGLLKLFLSAETQDIVLLTNLCSHWGQTGNSGQSFPLLSGRRYTCSLLQSSTKRVDAGSFWDLGLRAAGQRWTGQMHPFCHPSDQVGGAHEGPRALCAVMLCPHSLEEGRPLIRVLLLHPPPEKRWVASTNKHKKLMGESKREGRG